MNIRTAIIILAIALSCCLIFIAVKQNYIILNFYPSAPTQATSAAAHKKKITLYFWHNDQWKQEEVPLLFDTQIYNNVYHMVSQYLQLLHDESIIKNKTIVQKVLMNYDNQEIFVSFDRLPWNKDACTFEKLMVIEGLLKTLKKNEPSIEKVRFLMNHQPMVDVHLDFTSAWLIDGFLTT